MHANVEFAQKVALAYGAVCKPLCRELGLTQTAFDILLFLANNPSYRTARDIVEVRHIKANLVSVNVDKLVQEGYLTRQPVAGDRRKTALACTPRAQEVIRRGRQLQTAFFDSLFRKRKKNGEWKIVEAPDLGVLAVDAHCHLQYQKNPGLALARAGLHGVGFMCTVVDVYEDGTTTYDSLSKWNHEAALSMQRLFSRC